MREFITIVESASRPALDDAAVRAFAEETRERFGLKVFFITLTRGDIKVDSLIASQKGQGQGTAAMDALCRFADAHQTRIVLTPGQRDDTHGTTSHGRLVGFYKRFGFKPNKGSRKDFTVSATMLRDPR